MNEYHINLSGYGKAVSFQLFHRRDISSESMDEVVKKAVKAMKSPRINAEFPSEKEYMVFHFGFSELPY